MASNPGAASVYVATDELLRLVWRGLDHNHKDDADSLLSWLTFYLRLRVVEVPEPLIPVVRRLAALPKHTTEKQRRGFAPPV